MTVPDRANNSFRRVDPRVLAEAFLRSKGMTGDDAIVGGNTPPKTMDGYTVGRLQERVARRKGSSTETLASFMSKAPGVESEADVEHNEALHQKHVAANRARVDFGDVGSNVSGGPVPGIAGRRDLKTNTERDPRRRRNQ